MICFFPNKSILIHLDIHLVFGWEEGVLGVVESLSSGVHLDIYQVPGWAEGVLVAGNGAINIFSS